MIAAALLAAAAVLAPSGKWQVAYDNDACRLSRAFGADGGTVLSFSSDHINPASGSLLFGIVTAPRPEAKSEAGPAILHVGGGPAIRESFQSGNTANGATHVVRSSLAGEAFAKLIGTPTLEIMAGKDHLAFATGLTKQALVALQSCTRDLWRTWKLDPDEADRIATPAKSRRDSPQWVTQDDYPADPLRKHIQGNVLIAWAIGIDGTVTDCRTLVSSGNKDLDDGACRLVTTRGAYKPAIGKDGKPMVSHTVRTIAWVLPRG